MCKDRSKNEKTTKMMKFLAYALFGFFGLIGGGLYLDYMATQRHRCHIQKSHFNERETPDCYSHHFFGVGWLIMASVVPFFGIFGHCKPKLTIYGAILAFIAGSFGFYYIIMIFLDDRPYDFKKDRQPRGQFAHGFIQMAVGYRSGFELLQTYIASFIEKEPKLDRRKPYQEKNAIKEFKLVEMKSSERNI